MTRPSISKLALLGAASLLAMALVPGAVLGAAPVYTIDVTKTADVTVLPGGGGDVTYTITVKNTTDANGSADLQVVIVTDSDSGCTLSAPTGDDGNSKLDKGETWTYTCTVSGVVPPHTNTANARACHDGSIDQCNNDTHAATDSASVTVTKATAAPAAGATLPPTDSVTGKGLSTDSLGLILMALAAILATIMVVTPARIRRRL